MFMMYRILGVLFALFVLMFAAIVVEETLLGGRRRRLLERKTREGMSDR
jgi:hypothetical protein